MRCKSYVEFRDLCHGVKCGDPRAIEDAALYFSNTGEIKSDSILVPVPQHVGRATYMLAVAEQISRLTGCTVKDVLRCKPRPSRYETKKKGLDLPTGIFCIEKVPGPCVVIDNMIATGRTMNDCLKVLGRDAQPIALAAKWQ